MIIPREYINYLANKCSYSISKLADEERRRTETLATLSRLKESLGVIIPKNNRLMVMEGENCSIVEFKMVHITKFRNDNTLYDLNVPFLVPVVIVSRDDYITSIRVFSRNGAISTHTLLHPQISNTHSGSLDTSITGIVDAQNTGSVCMGNATVDNVDVMLSTMNYSSAYHHCVDSNMLKMNPILLEKMCMTSVVTHDVYIPMFDINICEKVSMLMAENLALTEALEEHGVDYPEIEPPEKVDIITSGGYHKRVSGEYEDDYEGEDDE